MCFLTRIRHYQSPHTALSKPAYGIAKIRILYCQNPHPVLVKPVCGLVYTPYTCVFKSPAPFDTVSSGLCAKWANRAIDEMISLNYWPVRFEDAENKYDFNTRFTVGVWVFYVDQMYGRPEIHSDIAKMVLEYMYSQPSLVVKAWRNRIYKFTSGTYFKLTTVNLRDWLDADDKDSDDEEVQHNTTKTRTLALRKLRDVDGMFTLLADAMYEFMRLKNSPFPCAFRSKEAFLEVKSWKRAMIFINMYRFVLEMPANKQWYHFGKENYRLNKVLFRRYLTKDEDIVRAGTLFNKLKDTSVKIVKRKASSDSLMDTLSPAKTVIRIDSSDED